MTSAASARSALRDATSGHHQRVDAIFSTAALGDRASYAQFLRAQAAAHIPAESALERGGIAELVADWPARKRTALLEADLEALGESVPPPVRDLMFEGEAAMLGALYVLEGSRLGGAVLRRAVPADFPARFLGGVDSSAWRSLLAILDARLGDAQALQRAIEAAGTLFTAFEIAGLTHLKGGQGASLAPD